MKKFSILALALILTAGLLTACTGTTMDETTGPSGTTAPSTTASTAAPTTKPTTTPTTAPTTNPTETTGGVNTMDPTGNGKGRMGPRLPWPGMPEAR